MGPSLTEGTDPCARGHGGVHAVWRGAPSLGVLVSLWLNVSLSTWGPYVSNFPHVRREGHNEALHPEELWDNRKASGLQGVRHTHPEEAAVGRNIPLSREKHPRQQEDSSTVTTPPTGERATSA